MANQDDYLTSYREFFENFAQTVNPNDQLPVKLASYKLLNTEVVGGIIDWTTQYLSQKDCPSQLLPQLIKIIIEETRKECKKQPILCGFNEDDNAYEPLKLMQTVMAKTNEICLRYLDNSKLCSLPAPGSPFHITSVHAVKNTRRRMEDRHVIIHDLNTMFFKQEASPSSYYAVFDGHAGHDAAAYSSAHLHQFLAESQFFMSNPEKALYDAFCKTDSLFLTKCEVENLRGGTTAVCALLRPKEKFLYIAWVGDSQALLVKEGKLLQCVNPHKPDRQDERERIEKNGGMVMMFGIWRVNGQLAVSRAIGDAEYKSWVPGTPEVKRFALDGNEDFLILACDGLWDNVTEDDAARMVYYLIAEKPDDTDRITLHLVQLAKQQGSSDNISVIIVFLRDPHKIAAEAHWANRNGPSVSMDAGLDNANNPFSNSNGANKTDNHPDDLLLNIDNLKASNRIPDFSPSADDFFVPQQLEKGNNGKLPGSFDEDDDEDFGPETDVDAVDDVLMSPAKALAEGMNNNPLVGVEDVAKVVEFKEFNPFGIHQEKAVLEMELDLQKQQSSEFDERRSPREETPTPPADTVHDVSGLVDNAGESESEDEWNYIKGEDATNKENLSPSQPEKEVADLSEDDNMSNLNPNAAEFVPVSPTKTSPSPISRALINDDVIAQSPQRPTQKDLDIKLPNPSEFEEEVKSRPSEIDSKENGHDVISDSNELTLSQEPIESILNGKSIDEIPEFQPSPSKTPASDEFHFGPNAAPFTPVKLLDQSEALSTQAVYGDDTTAFLSFNESTSEQEPTKPTDICDFAPKEQDPMSMSFYQDKDDVLTTNPFDLNKVQMLPDNLDEFLKNPEEASFNETISDLPEHDPLQKPEVVAPPVLGDLLGGFETKDDDVLTKSENDISPEVPDAQLMPDGSLSESPLPTSPFPQMDLQETSPLPEDNPQELSHENLNFAQVVSTAVENSVPVEDTSFISEKPTQEPMDLEPVVQITQQSEEVTSPISPVQQSKEIEEIASILGSIPAELQRCVFPLPDELINRTVEQNIVDVTTENITPEYPEETQITPSEESKQSDDVPTAPLVEEPPKGVTDVSAGAVASKVEDVPVVAEKKSTKTVGGTVAAAKKPASKVGTKAPVGKSSLGTTKPAPITKAGATKTGATKTAPTATLKTSTPKPSPRPKTAPVAAARSAIDKKPLTNGDAKKTIKSTTATTTTVKKTDSALGKTAAPKPSARAATAPTRPAVSSATTKPKTTSTLTSRPATTRLNTTSTTTTRTSAPRPPVSKASVTLSARTTTATTTTSPKPRPAPVASTKPRVPLTKTVSKGPDTEKQIKDSANKLTASRTTTSRTMSGTATRTTTTVKKTEVKALSNRTTAAKTTTTTTTTKSTTAKKPAELIRNKTTKTTKIEKPKQNGVSTVVTEEIIVNEVAALNLNDSEPQLVKDVSPIDNKLIVDNLLIQTNAAD